MEFQAEGALGSALARVASRSSAGDRIEVDAIDFSQACALAGGRPAFVKMDIEGAELEVIASSRHIIGESPMHLAIDSNHLVEGRLTKDRLESLFKEIGYSVFSSADSGFLTTWAWSTAMPDPCRTMM